LGKAYGLNTQVLLANLQHFCNNIIILNYYYFIPGLFPSHSWWAESCSVRLSREMVCRDGVQPATLELPGCPSAWTTGRMDSVNPVPNAQVCVFDGTYYKITTTNYISKTSLHITLLGSFWGNLFSLFQPEIYFFYTI
jgi:hypothetical protein